jgi:hypothetical protein
MNRTLEMWLRVVLIVAACILLVDEALDRDWVWAGLWAVALLLVCRDLVRSRRRPADDPHEL